jgi:hypothetical protein
MMIPPKLARNVRAYWPETGERWLAALPELVDKITGAWG